MTSRTTDRRFWHRVGIKLPVEFQIQGHAGSAVDHLGHTVDLSVGGVSLRCQDFKEELFAGLAEDELVAELQIWLGSNTKLLATAKVVSSKEIDDGTLLRLDFVDLDRETQDRIHKFLRPHY